MTDAQLKTYLDTFTHDGTGDVKRELFVVYLREKSTDDWTALGYQQESAGIENNYEEESIKDILGDVWNSITSKDEQINMSEYKIHDERSAFLDNIWKMTLAGLEHLLNTYQLLMVCGWLKDTNGNMFAREVDNVSVRIDNMGGQGYTTSDLNISGISQGVFGTVANLKNPTFTPGTIE